MPTHPHAAGDYAVIVNPHDTVLSNPEAVWGSALPRGISAAPVLVTGSAKALGQELSHLGGNARDAQQAALLSLPGDGASPTESSGQQR